MFAEYNKDMPVLSKLEEKLIEQIKQVQEQETAE